MAKVEMNEVYVNRKNPERKATVCKVDEKAKTVILREESGKAIGPMSFPTLSKSWKRVEQKVSDVKSEEFVSDGASYSEVMSDIINDEKIAKKSVKSNEKKEVPVKSEKSVSTNTGKKKFVWDTDFVDTVKDSIFKRIKKDFTAVTYEKCPGIIVLKRNGKTVIEIRVSRAGIIYKFRESDLPESYSGCTIKTCKYHLPAAIKDENTDDYTLMLDTFLTTLKNNY